VNYKNQLIRKITNIGKSRGITLPPYWLAVVGLEAGDDVTVIPNRNNELVVRPKKRSNEEVEQ
jgi:antitoxin component of MazEF toxin-antitoxin module